MGGLIVGMTSVGSGSLMIVLLLFLYPMLGGQPAGRHRPHPGRSLTAAAALGAVAFGHIEFSVTTSLIIGSVPAVLVGSFLSSRAPDRYIRPAITFVIFASGLKYVGVSTTAPGLDPLRRAPGRVRRVAGLRAPVEAGAIESDPSERAGTPAEPATPD